ncbi:unnamed protein product [Agarophyton chilense]
MSLQRKSLFRQTRLQFRSSDPKQQPSSSSPSHTPLKPLPRPTAPPVFQNSTPKKRIRKEKIAFDEELWDMGKRILEGDTLPPRRNFVEEGAPILQDGASNSDEDFEHESVFSQVARQRPQLLTPSSRMRNDRSSMTKSSANRGKKTKKVFAFTTPSQKRSTPFASSRQNTAPVLESSSSEEEVDHVVFEGEKSELSDTDEDEPLAALHRKSLNQEKLSSRSPTDVPCGSAQRNVKQSSCIRTALNSQGCVNDFPKSGQGLEMLGDERRATPKSTPKRACELPQLFSEESDDSMDKPIWKGSHRKRVRKIRRIEESSDEDDQADNKEMVSNRTLTRLRTAVDERESAVDPDLFPVADSKHDCEQEKERELDHSIDKEYKVKQRRRKPPDRSHFELHKQEQASRLVSRKLFHSSFDSTTSPVRGKTRRKLSFAGSQGNEITPPSTPSPPSTKKRSLRSKLITVSSDEEDEFCIDRSKLLDGPENTEMFAEPNKVAGDSEWYHERKIDTFSSSGDDAVEPIDNPSPGKIIAISSKKRVSASKPGSRSNFLAELCPNSKDPVLEASVEYVDSGDLGKVIASKDTSDHEIMNTSRVNHEVIDLVDDDDDDFEEITPTNIKNNCVFSLNNGLNVSDIENLRDVPECNIDDSKPPPFNLYILCNEGESITDMKDRLGEDALMDRVMQARNDGREIIGGDQLGLTTTFNKDVFSRFSKTVVGDRVTRKRKTASVTEKALRGEYRFNYRGKERDQMRRGRASLNQGSKQTVRGSSYRGRLSSLGNRRQRRT